MKHARKTVVLCLIASISAAAESDTNLYSETFSCEPIFIRRILEFNNAASQGEEALSQADLAEVDEQELKDAFTRLGVDWPSGSTVQYVDWSHRIAIRNTPENIRRLQVTLPQLCVLTYSLEVELQCLAVPRSHAEPLVQSGELRTESLIGLLQARKARMLLAPHAAGIAGRDIVVGLQLPDRTCRVTMRPEVSADGETINLSIESDLLQTSVALELGSPRLLVGGNPIGNKELLYIIATIWRVSSDGRLYPRRPDLEPTVGGDGKPAPQP